MGGNTLLVRHLPSSLMKEEKEDLLRHFGAIAVRVMDTKGPMKHTAFATFLNENIAQEVMKKLHQVQVLDCRLVVEIANAKDEDIPLPDLKSKQKTCDARDQEQSAEENGSQPEQNDFDFSFLHWGMKYPRRRRLFYLYPPPSPSILTNICNALAAYPRFYVQALHLMNRMDLPAPFGPVMPTPPLAPDGGVCGYKNEVEQVEMEVSSSEESELGSDTNVAQHPDAPPMKRKRTESKRKMKKRAKMTLAMLQTAAPFVSSSNQHTLSLPLKEVFDKTGESGSMKKIELRLQRSVVVHTSDGTSVGNVKDMSDQKRHRLPSSPTSRQDESSPQLSNENTIRAPDVLKDEPEKLCSDGIEHFNQASGFGRITPVVKVSEEGDVGGDYDKGWSETKFISHSELHRGRLSHKETGNCSLFHNYSKGEPNRRLYIKNLAKQVTEEDLHWIFGRYVNWDNDSEKEIFDIRLMKEGRMKGQAFVTLPQEKQGVRAVNDTNTFVLKGKPIVVSFARSAKLQSDQKP